jgi:hypothetical protein
LRTKTCTVGQAGGWINLAFLSQRTALKAFEMTLSLAQRERQAQSNKNWDVSNADISHSIWYWCNSWSRGGTAQKWSRTQLIATVIPRLSALSSKVW